MASPYSGTTTGGTDNVNSCGRGNDEVFFIDLQPGLIINIGQDSNAFDSKHETRWGGACPGDHQVHCTDDPDTERHHWANTQGQTERLYFIIDAFSSTGHGDFVLSWSVQTAPPPATPGQACTDETTCPVGTRVMLSADACSFGDACDGGASIQAGETGEIISLSSSTGHPNVQGPNGETWYFQWPALVAAAAGSGTAVPPPPPPPGTTVSADQIAAARARASASGQPCCSDWCDGCGHCAPGQCGASCGDTSGSPACGNVESCEHDC